MNCFNVVHGICAKSTRTFIEVSSMIRVVRVLYPWTNHGFNLTTLRSWINELVAIIWVDGQKLCQGSSGEEKDTLRRDIKGENFVKCVYSGGEEKKGIFVRNEWNEIFNDWILTLAEKCLKSSYVDGNTRFLSWLMLSLRLYLLCYVIFAIVHRSILDRIYIRV